ncbi:MAG: TadE/TadG family type IV pilus assembly protein [Chloroflexota bacterium]
MPCQRRGAAQALVESALVLPLLIMLSLGVLQVLLYAHARDVLVSAVQEGARLSAEDGRSLDEGYARAEALVTAGLGTSVEPVRLDGSLDDEVVALRVSASLRPILPLPLVTGLPIRAEGRVARERFRPAGGRK